MSSAEIPDSVVINGHTVRRGSVVRLQPSQRADIFDLALRGQKAIVDSVEQDMDDRTHLAVTLADDPGRDLSARIGQRFFFGPDEVQPLGEESAFPPPRILVAGIGNVFLGDDGFGVELIHSLRERGVADHVDLADLGIRGMDLVYVLGNGYSTVILADAAQRGQVPGTVSLVEPDLDGEAASLDTHHMDPLNALRQARQTGPIPKRVLLVACEPQQLPDDEQDVVMELSPAVRAAIGEATDLVLRLLDELVAETEPEEVSKG